MKVPFDFIYRDKPVYVDIELNEKKGRYDSKQKRSSYQAEFLRAWRSGQDKNILVGLYHVPEIKYFLENGVKDERIVNLAQEHVNLLYSDHRKYVIKLSFNTSMEVLKSGFGIAIGASPYLTAIPYGLLFLKKIL